MGTLNLAQYNIDTEELEELEDMGRDVRDGQKIQDAQYYQLNEEYDLRIQFNEEVRAELAANGGEKKPKENKASKFYHEEAEEVED